jgi:hypothetical protein
VNEIIAGVIEKSLIGGAFLYLLHYFVNVQTKLLSKISDTLLKVSNTLSSLDRRMSKLEQRVNDLEGRK